VNGVNMNFPFPLSFQLDGLNTKKILEALNKNKKNDKILGLLQKRNIYGVELNLLDYSAIKPANLADFLSSYNLKLTYIATGAYAKENKLSLSSPDVKVREKTICELKNILQFANETKQQTGVICGFIKGVAGYPKREASELLHDSLSQVSSIVKKLKTPLLLEVTNRYESSVANNIKETVDLIQDFQNLFLHILPDTFHMNIEESNSLSELHKYKNYFNSIHLSDNNRYFPGYGAIDFYQILMMLKISGYKHGVAIEGNINGDIEENINFTVDYLTDISRKLEVF